MGGVEAGNGTEGLLGHYLYRNDGRPSAGTTIIAIDITVRTPPIDLPS